MRIFITGATGFVGRALTLRLIGSGHEVIAWVRDERRARNQLGPDVKLAPTSSNIGDQVAAADAVINLAGESIFGGRWTAERKRALADSRLNLTRDIVSAIAAAPTKSRVLISASAVGYYGDRGDEIVEDNAAPGSDFLANVCRDWEGAALKARESGVRVFVPRLGIVLGAEGGALATMLIPFRIGAGGPIGSGRQYVPWIHLDDLITIIVTALEDDRYSGPMIAAGPNPITSRQLAAAIGAVLHRPSFMPAPALALRIALGEMATMLLTGQRVNPQRLNRAGFSWRYPTIETALADILKDHEPVIQRFGVATPQPSNSDSEYLKQHRPRFMLMHQTMVSAPVQEVFAFFSKPQNLGVMTPSAMGFQIEGAMPDEIRRNLIIEYTLRVGPIPLRWRTCIEEWQPPRGFADSQESGPYSCWWHEHHFQEDGSQTLMEDRVYYAPPLGPLGDVANALFVAPMLRRIFAYRSQMMRLRFPGTAQAKT